MLCWAHAPFLDDQHSDRQSCCIYSGLLGSQSNKSMQTANDHEEEHCFNHCLVLHVLRLILIVCSHCCLKCTNGIKTHRQKSVETLQWLERVHNVLVPPCAVILYAFDGAVESGLGHAREGHSLQDCPLSQQHSLNSTLKLQTVVVFVTGTHTTAGTGTWSMHCNTQHHGKFS